MKIETFPVPHTRDPFVNTPLICAGFDPDSGEERFWISTWNDNVGCLGALVTPSGKSRIYRFEKQDGLIGCGAYSAHLTDNDTLWLISDLQAFVKLDLPTGKYEIYKTGAPSGLVFPGMQYDEKTNKLFAGAFIPPDLHAVSFDINEKTAKIFNGFTKASTMRGGFPIGDGTYGLCVLLNEYAVYRWNPTSDTLNKLADFDCDNINALTTIACDSKGRHYVHGMGWMHADATIDADCIADEELLFFGCIGDMVYGSRGNSACTEVCTWNTKTGEIKTVFASKDHCKYNLTSDGKIIGVSLYGELALHSTEGEELFSTMLDTNSPGTADCMIRISDELILGTPFISQRFWLINTKTGECIDAGRAAPGGGEVLEVWAMNGKAYMASYTQGVLTEFDPKLPFEFPKNPKILCQPKHSMRPIARAAIGDEIFYSSTHEYGELGCEITRYNVTTCETVYENDPLHGQALTSFCVTRDQSLIISGTTFEADCGTAPPVSDDCFITELCPKTLKIISTSKAPAGCCRATVVGYVDEDRILCAFNMRDEGKILGTYSKNSRSIEVLDAKISASAQLMYAGKDNLFVLFTDGRISLTCLREGKLFEQKELLKDEKIYRIFTHQSEIYAATPRDVYIISGALE